MNKNFDEVLQKVLKNYPGIEFSENAEPGVCVEDESGMHYYDPKEFYDSLYKKFVNAPPSTDAFNYGWVEAKNGMAKYQFGYKSKLCNCG